MGKRGAILVEGQGELGAVDNLIARLWKRSGHGHVWMPPRRWTSLHTAAGLTKAVQSYRSQGLGGLLVLRDEDDRCPAETAPALAALLASFALPFPVALVLLHPEYEVLFLPCLPSLAGKRLPDGRPALRADARWTRDSWESRRGVKEFLSSQYVPGKAYKPTLDQEPLTRMLDLDVVRRAEVPCFGTLERSLAFLDGAWEKPGLVYPPPAA